MNFLAAAGVPCAISKAPPSAPRTSPKSQTSPSHTEPGDFDDYGYLTSLVALPGETKRRTINKRPKTLVFIMAASEIASIPTPAHCTADFCLIPVGIFSLILNLFLFSLLYFFDPWIVLDRSVCTDSYSCMVHRGCHHTT